MKRPTSQALPGVWNAEHNQSLTGDSSHSSHDRPIGGVVRPVHGTIEAPIVVVDAGGTIGEALVRQLIASGQPVVAVARRPDNLSRLVDGTAPGAVTPIVARIDTDPEARQLADELRRLGRPLAGVVAIVPHLPGAQGSGRLLEHSTDVLADCLQRTLLAQHALARRLVPLLAESGRNARYVIVGGAGSETPWAGHGQRSVAMAATRMLARVLHEEARACGVRVQLLSVDAPVRSEPPGEHECPEWPAAEDVASSIAHLLERRLTEDPTDVVVSARVRATGASGRTRRDFDGVPSFLESLRLTTRRIASQ